MSLDKRGGTEGFHPHPDGAPYPAFPPPCDRQATARGTFGRLELPDLPPPQEKQASPRTTTERDSL